MSLSQQSPRSPLPCSLHPPEEVDELVVSEVWYPLDQDIQLGSQEVQLLKVLRLAEAGLEEAPRDDLPSRYLGDHKLAAGSLEAPTLLCDVGMARAAEDGLDGRRVTYDDIQKATGIFPSTLSRVAAARGKRIDLTVLERLCEHFGCEPGDLLVLQRTLADRRSIRSRSRTGRRFGGRGRPLSPP